MQQRIQAVFEQFAHQLADKEYVETEFLANLIDVYRPKTQKSVALQHAIDLSPLLDYLEQHPVVLTYFVSYLQRLLFQKDFDLLITDAGIISFSTVKQELRKRIVEKYLPEQPAKNTLKYILNQLFYKSTDIDWIDRIPFDQLLKLYDLLAFNNLYDLAPYFEIKDILYGMEVLLQRISGRAMETEVSKMVPEFQNFDSPFIGIIREFSELNVRILTQQEKFIQSDDLAYKQLLVLHKQCESYIDTAFSNSQRYGISIQVNQSLLRIRQQLARLREILSFLVIDAPEQKQEKTIQLAKTLIGYNCRKTNIRKLIGESTQLLSYEITHHTAQTGEHYITSNKREYWEMFRSASLGGVIVGLMCVVKLLLGYIHTSEFGHAFYYSINYAVGFTAIYLLGGTLATKQPAMTASAMVAAIENVSNDKGQYPYRYWNFAVFFARLFRSQFIAFVGNVLWAFPVSLFIVWGIQQLTGSNIAAPKWLKLVNDLNLSESPVILHASIAGVFLFLSGIIAGSISNRDKHHSIYYRIEEHPLLKKVFGREKTLRIAKFYEKKWAGIISNIWFGVFMGSVSSIGLFLGLNLDIRHITFGSGNLALGLFGRNMDLTMDTWVWAIFGIGLIGFFNFLVSFSLSLTLALRSRNRSFAELWKMGKAVFIYFTVNPKDFFFPPKNKI